MAITGCMSYQRMDIEKYIDILNYFEDREYVILEDDLLLKYMNKYGADDSLWDENVKCEYEEERDLLDVCEPTGEFIDQDDNKNIIRMRLEWLGGSPLIFVTLSPYTTKTRLCSPCCPNCGDLDSEDENGIETYDIPPEWRFKDE